MSESELPLPIADDDSGDLEWLLRQLEACTEDPDEQILPGEICDECEPVVPLPGDLSRATCTCSQRCITLAMKKASRMVRVLRYEVCDQHFLFGAGETCAPKW